MKSTVEIVGNEKLRKNSVLIIYLRCFIDWALCLFIILQYCNIAILRVPSSNSQIFSLKFIHYFIYENILLFPFVFNTSFLNYLTIIPLSWFNGLKFVRFSSQPFFQPKKIIFQELSPFPGNSFQKFRKPYNRYNP